MEGFAVLSIAAPLLRWYKQNARQLPWRENTDAYRVLVSEIMLQQTRVEAVKPYFLRFMAALPDIAALAAAEEERLLKLWEGLGYYSRARNLRRTARIVVEAFGGRLPASMEELLKLPGIGPYTAGAVASIAYNIPVPAVDGNVLRVLARLSDCALDISEQKTRRAAEQAVTRMLPADSPGAFNQALMELGACICLPNAAPACEACPVADLCKGRAAGTAASLPVKTKKAPRRIEELTVFALWQGERFTVRKRAANGLLAGLWELPNVPGHLDERAFTQTLSGWGAAPTGNIVQYAKKHIFTHVEWHMRVFSLPVEIKCLQEGWEWAQVEGGMHALPTAFRVCLRH